MNEKAKMLKIEFEDRVSRSHAEYDLHTIFREWVIEKLAAIIEVKIKCIVIKPNLGQSKSVRNWLDQAGVSYSYDEEDNIIFANLTKAPHVLRFMAEAYDPVFLSDDGKWKVRLDGDRERGEGSIEDSVFDSEQDARAAFAHYISWSGEFVNNASKS